MRFWTWLKIWLHGAYLNEVRVAREMAQSDGSSSIGFFWFFAIPAAIAAAGAIGAGAMKAGAAAQEKWTDPRKRLEEQTKAGQFRLNYQQFGGTANQAVGDALSGQNSKMDFGDLAGARAGMGRAAQSYEETLAGKTPSIAQKQLQMGNEQTLQNMRSIAAGATGQAGLAQAQRMAMQQGTEQSRALSAQQSMLRAQEIEQARSGMAATYGNMGQLDMSKQQTLLGERQFLGQMGMNMKGMDLQADTTQMMANFQREQMMANMQQWYEAMKNGQNARIWGGAGDAFQGGMNALASGAGNFSNMQMQQQMGQMGRQGGMGYR